MRNPASAAGLGFDSAITRAGCRSPAPIPIQDEEFASDQGNHAAENASGNKPASVV